MRNRLGLLAEEYDAIDEPVGLEEYAEQPYLSETVRNFERRNALPSPESNSSENRVGLSVVVEQRGIAPVSRRYPLSTIRPASSPS